MEPRKKNKFLKRTVALLLLLLLLWGLVWLQTKVERVPEKPQAVAGQALSPLMTVPKIQYAWKLYDLYDQQDFVLHPKTELPSKVFKSFNVAWEKGSKSQRVYLQVSTSMDFESKESYDTANDGFGLTSVSIGDNFWRISSDQKVWSEPSRFKVEPGYLPDPPPQAIVPSHEIAYNSEIVFAPIELKTTMRPLGFVMEASTSATFDPVQTKTFWTQTSKFRISFFQPGEYYYRFRAANLSQELTDWSLPQKFTVLVPNNLGAPKPFDEFHEQLIGQPIRLSWRADPRTKKFEVEIRDPEGSLMRKVATDSQMMEFMSQQPGRFKAYVRGLDQWGRSSPNSKPIVMNYISELPQPKLAKKEEAVPLVSLLPDKLMPQDRQLALADRKPDSILEQESAAPMILAPSGSSSMRIEGGRPVYNDTYHTSKLQIEASAWTLQSKEQLNAGVEPPLSTGAGIRSHTWWDNHGLELAFKSAATGVNESASTVAPMQAEARYHRRKITDMPFGIARELQVSVFGGLEVYKNKASPYFSPHYELFKFGTALEFPLARRWDTGGEFAFGQGVDNSQKYELAGHLHFYLDKKWSAGAGYRVHLFEAGSRAVAPTAVPYREGYTEGYSVLRYHF